MSASASTSSLSLPAALVHSKHPRALLHELQLLSQLLYKSSAQFRSAKWVQSVRALRKCGRRIFADARDEHSKNPRRSRRRRRSSAQVKGELGPNSKTAMDKGKARADDIFKSHPESGNSIRLSPAPMGHAVWQMRNRADLQTSVQNLIALLRHMDQRAKASHAMISAHLRTPPAPTFAPLATSLLGICAQCGTAASSWADELERIDWSRASVGPRAVPHHATPATSRIQEQT
ncbi:hypothetical protein V8E36_005150 [Tilletia maclaganii]